MNHKWQHGGVPLRRYPMRRSVASSLRGDTFTVSQQFPILFVKQHNLTMSYFIRLVYELEENDWNSG